MAPTEQKALVLPAKLGEFELQSRAVPNPGKGEVLARIDATALNPVDWKIKVYGLDFLSYPGIVGTDGAGVVEEVGEGVTNLKKGDKMYGFFLPPLAITCLIAFAQPLARNIRE
jgi:NADPH:quinone reductase-like Zn-dependent oxidoreductase